jgi:hypothetical protein
LIDCELFEPVAGLGLTLVIVGAAAIARRVNEMQLTKIKASLFR